MEAAIDIALVALIVAVIACLIEVCRCFRRIAAAKVRALNAQAEYWQSGDDDDWWKTGEEKMA